MVQIHDLKLSQWWRSKLWSCGLWYCIMMK